MSLPFTVEAIDNIAEEHRSLYKESNGKFVLDVEGYDDPTALKSALQKEREAARTYEKQVKAWGALGKTPEEIQQLLEAHQKAEENKALKGGEWEKLKEQMQSQQAKERDVWTAEKQAMQSAIDRNLIDAQAAQAITRRKGSTILLLPHIKAQTRVVQDGGEYTVRVVDKAGNPRVNGKGDYLAIDDLVDEMYQSDEFSRAFEATGITGGGAAGNHGSNGNIKTISAEALEKMRPAERAKFFASGGRQAI